MSENINSWCRCLVIMVIITLKCFNQAAESLNTEVYTHTQKEILLFLYPLEHKLSVISTLDHQAEKFLQRFKIKIRNASKTALQTCIYPSLVFVKSAMKSRKNTTVPNRKEKERDTQMLSCHT